MWWTFFKDLFNNLEEPITVLGIPNKLKKPYIIKEYHDTILWEYVISFQLDFDEP